MIGSAYSRFKTEDCSICKLPFETVMPCDFCGAFACMEHFRESWKECPDCGLYGCGEHFDGMFCKECIEEQQKDYTEEEKNNEDN